MRAGTHSLAIVMADRGFGGRVPRGPHTAVFSLNAARSLDVRSSADRYFVFASASELVPVAELVRKVSSIHRLGALFVRADVDCTWFLPMFEKANLRTLRNTIVHTDPAVPQRVVNAWQVGAQDKLIADATVSDGRLFVRSCALDSFDIGFGDLPALARLPEEERINFTIDEDGSFLHWDWNDIHVGLEMIRSAGDPDFRDASRLQRLTLNRRFGIAVRDVREKRGLRQADIAGLSARQVSRIESGAGAPRYETIQKIARAHSLTVQQYLDAIAASLSEG
ncbi:MAG: helix-turn-helix domain-containing protein [Coriobacteriia bacterium]